MAVLAVVAENYTTRGKSAVILNEFAYIFDVNLSLDKKRWKCINYMTCKAYIWVHEGLIVKIGGIHMHDVEPERIEAKKRVRQFKSDVVAQRHAQLEGLTAAARDCETVVQDSMPSTKALKQTGRRARVKVFSLLSKEAHHTSIFKRIRDFNGR
jgi:hypothetical protein